MKIFVLTLACVLFYALSILSISARLMIIPPPEELADQATLICNGKVESITDDATGTEYPGYSKKQLYSTIHLTAKIKILHVFKGRASSEVEIKYHIDPMTNNGPIQIRLVKGERFRFFLRNGADASSYVGVFDGSMDDGFSVEPLALSETDDSAYISKPEAIQITRSWLQVHHPELLPLLEKRSELMHFQDNWTIIFPDKSHLFIIISGDRMVKESDNPPQLKF